MKSFKNILVALDTRSETHPALDWAVKIAKQNEAKIKLIEVLPKFTWFQRQLIGNTDDLLERMVGDSKAKLANLSQAVQAENIEVEALTLIGKTSDEIVKEVAKAEHDLVIRLAKGSHSRSSKPFGTTGMRLMRTCGCAVLLVQTGHPVSFDCILAAIDPASDDALVKRMNANVIKFAQSAAEVESGQLHIVHAWQLFGSTHIKSRIDSKEFEQIEQKAQATIETTLDQFLEPFGLDHNSPEVHLVREESKPSNAITRLADQYEAPLIVMGTVARSGLMGALMGNTAEEVLDHVDCSVLVIKPDHYSSPH